MVRSISETKLTVWFKNGSTTSRKGAAEPDKLGGRGLKCVVLDEYADMDPDVWRVIRPQFADLRMEMQYGRVFIGFPCRLLALQFF